MAHEITIAEQGRGFRLCKYNAQSGVGNNPSDRELFKKLFKNRKIDYYICDKCKYYCIGNQYDILLDSLEEIKTDARGGLYINLITNERLYLTSRNFLIICDSEKCINPNAWVKEYLPKRLQK